MNRTIAAAVAAAMLAGCSTAPSKIASQSVSPLQYQAYDCDQLYAEELRIGTRKSALEGRLQTASDNDAAITGVGLVLFWPALFFLGGTKAEEAEYGRLRGEYEAVQSALITKKCPPKYPSAEVK